MANYDVEVKITTFRIINKEGDEIYSYSTNHINEDGIIYQAFENISRYDRDSIFQLLDDLYPNNDIMDTYDASYIVETKAITEYSEYFKIEEEFEHFKGKVDIWAVVGIESCEEIPFVESIYPTLGQALTRNKLLRSCYIYPMRFGEGIDMDTYFYEFGDNPKFTEC